MIKQCTLLVIFLMVGCIFTSINGKMLDESCEFIDNQLVLDDETDFDKKITFLMKIGHIPSLSACVIKKDKVVWARSYGYCDLKTRKKPDTNNTIYPIASVSKSVTVTTIM